MRIALALLLVLVGLGGLAGFRLVGARLETAVYRDRLASIERDYSTLRTQYENLVRRTAVTELVVENGTLSVRVRTADGSVLSFPTPYDPSGEVYVDYVVQDGRLWIRRVFDEHTPPGDGMLIDPALGHVDWDADVSTQGKAAYRSLGEGRWVVTVSGDGSLGLGPVAADETVVLATPPELIERAPASKAAQAALRDLEAGELLRAIAQEWGEVVQP